MPALTPPAYRQLPTPSDLAQWVCFKFERTVAADNTVQFGDQRLQLLGNAARRSYAKARVHLHQQMDGRLEVYYQGQLIASRDAPPETPKLRLERKTRPLPSPPPLPSPTRPLPSPPPLPSPTLPALSLEEALKRARAAMGPSPYDPRRRRPTIAPTNHLDTITEQLSGQNH